jgi:protein-L-isoaspartate O-methyltransferase
MTAIIPRSTVVELEAHRARALELYATAWEALEAAGRAHGQATVKGGTGGMIFSTGRYGDAKHYSALADREPFLDEARKQIDRGMWDHLILSTGIERLMDKTERDAFRDQLSKDPPPATADNVLATFERLAGEAGMIFARGLALAFSKLDRRFRSHDGFKIGARVVFNSGFSDGRWNYYSKRDEHLRDVERCFYVLDGKVQPDRSAGIVGTVDLARPALWGPQAFEAEDEYFRVRVFKNGNVHVWFKRDDLVEKVNLVLADHYGAVLGAGSDAAERTHEPTREMAKNFGFFETPPAVVARVIEEAYLQSGMTVLEPSAGKGALAIPAGRVTGHVVCVEVQPDLCLAHCGILSPDVLSSIHADFLDMTPERLGWFDRIVMNPPFDRGRDVDHVTHAMRFLKPGGRLVSVMSSGTEFREDRKTQDFRATVERFRGSFRDLPPLSFAESGTNVNTVMVTINAPLAAANDQTSQKEAA